MATQDELLKAIHMVESGHSIEAKSPFDGSKSLSDKMLPQTFSEPSNETPKSEAIEKQGDVADSRDGVHFGGLIVRLRKNRG